jgi:molecular chaperone DnaK (HSP70)
MSTGTIIGIDFGTTSSEVAVFRSGRAQVLSTPEGERIIPSAVYLDEEGRHFVGQAAKNVALLHPERTVPSAKRELGDPKRQATKRAAALATRGDVRLLVDVTPLGLGVETADARMVTLVPRNSVLPAQVRELFTTVSDGQRAAAGTPDIAVRFDIDVEDTFTSR